MDSQADASAIGGTADTAPPPHEIFDDAAFADQDDTGPPWILADDERTAGELSAPAGTLEDLVTRGIPQAVGRFQILRLLGHGGFGVVYLAYDPQLGRHVAIKLPRPEILMTDQLRKRFHSEAAAGATLDHPGIVPVFEAGEADGVCYLVTAYCAEGTLAEHLAQRKTPVPVRLAANLTALLADAVDYAHTRGVLHRDLKTANVLLETTFAVENAAKQQDELCFLPRLTDFGLARFMEAEHAAENSPEAARSFASEMTQRGTMLGTPRYMAPEQIECRSAEIGPATDVYGLGGLLYEVLTGQPPFTGRGRFQLVQQVLHEDPMALRRLRREIPRDLEAICLKCLEKSPAQRYRTAQELAADLRRFLGGKPTLAKPLSSFQRGVRWARRCPAAAALAALMVFASMATFAGTALHYARLRQYNDQLSRHALALEASLERETQQAREADFQRQRAGERERVARQQTYAALISRAWRMWLSGQRVDMCEVLDRLLPGAGQEDLRGFEWHYLWAQGEELSQVSGHFSTVWGAGFSSDSKLCASWDKEQIHVWNVPTRTLKCSLFAGSPPLTVRIGTDGDSVVSLHENGTVHVWDLEGRRIASFEHPESLPPSPIPPVFRPASTMAAYMATALTGANEQPRTEVRLWDWTNGSEKVVFEVAGRDVQALRFSPGGDRLAVAAAATGNAECSVSLLDVESSRVVREFPLEMPAVGSISFSADGRMLAVGAGKGPGRLTMLDLAQSTAVSTSYSDLNSAITVVGMAPGGEKVAVGCVALEAADRPEFLGMLNRNLRPLPLTPPTSGLDVRTVEFSPDGQTLAFGGQNGVLNFRKLGQKRKRFSWAAHDLETWCVAFSPDSRVLATASDDHTVKLWEHQTGRFIGELAGHESLVTSVAFAPDGAIIATASFDRTVRLWDSSTGRLLQTLEGHSGPLRGVAFRGDGKMLASISDDLSVKLWEIPSGRLQSTLLGHEDKIRSAVFHPDGRRLFTGDNHGIVRLWDVKLGCIERHWQAGSEANSLALSQRGDLLAVGTNQRFIQLYSVDEQITPIGRFKGQDISVRSLAFSPDGLTLASGGDRGTVRLWHIATEQELFMIGTFACQVNSVAFSPDGLSLAAALHDGTATVWQLPRGKSDIAE